MLSTAYHARRHESVTNGVTALKQSIGFQYQLYLLWPRHACYPQTCETSRCPGSHALYGRQFYAQARASVSAAYRPALAGGLRAQPTSRPQGITTGPDGNLWFAEYSTSMVARLTPTGQISTFPVRGNAPVEITAGPNNTLWYTDGVSSIGRLTFGR
ncbi:MAG TPA: hypothetical protein VKT82_24745 [Ktedonobacterales bacterium]|nr:hypothetical protein [Ktedonobacterales bacterium]